MAPRKKQEAEETRCVSPGGELQPQGREMVPASDAASVQELPESDASIPSVQELPEGDGDSSVPEGAETGPSAPVGGKQSPEAAALQALQRAKKAVEELAAHRRTQRLSDTRARNVAREVREQIKVIRAYGS